MIVQLALCLQSFFFDFQSKRSFEAFRTIKLQPFSRLTRLMSPESLTKMDLESEMLTHRGYYKTKKRGWYDREFQFSILFTAKMKRGQLTDKMEKNRKILQIVDRWNSTSLWVRRFAKDRMKSKETMKIYGDQYICRLRDQNQRNWQHDAFFFQKKTKKKS